MNDQTEVLPEAPPASKEGVFSCPECEAAGTPRTFTKAAALGAHRRSHGVRGVTADTNEKRKQRKQRRQEDARAREPEREEREREREHAASAKEEDDAVNPDTLIRALFPKGVPPNVGLLEDLMDWVREAERLKSFS